MISVKEWSLYTLFLASFIIVSGATWMGVGLYYIGPVWALFAIGITQISVGAIGIIAALSKRKSAAQFYEVSLGLSTAIIVGLLVLFTILLHRNENVACKDQATSKDICTYIRDLLVVVMVPQICVYFICCLGCIFCAGKYRRVLNAEEDEFETITTQVRYRPIPSALPPPVRIGAMPPTMVASAYGTASELPNSVHSSSERKMSADTPTKPPSPPVEYSHLEML